MRWLLVGGVSLLGCPQLLDDNFSLARLPVGSGGTGACSTPGCRFTGADAAVGGDGGANAGMGGSGAAGSGAAAGNGAAAGSTAQGGDGGSAVDGDAGTTPDAALVAPPDAADVGPDCRIVTLTSNTHSSANNCVGIYGWNSIENGSGSTLSRTYQDGNVCFSGGISNNDWGAVYNLTLANEDDWNANAYGATGFEFEFSGASLPPTLTILYTSNGDYCRAITPTGSVSVPFSTTHPCAGGGSSTPTLTSLTILQLNFTPGSSYQVDFCVQIRALP